MTTEPEMVERLAQVIFRSLIAKGGPGSTMMPWPFCPERDWCRATARAAIEAMMEPTPQMVRAGVAAMYDINGAAQFAADAYTAMLRSSLIEGDGKGPGPPDGPGIPPQPFG